MLTEHHHRVEPIQHVSQLNDRIQSLQDRIKHYEEFASEHEESKASKEREVWPYFMLISDIYILILQSICNLREITLCRQLTRPSYFRPN